MANKKVQLGDVEIKKLEISSVSGGKKLDIIPQTLQLSIFEDFMSPSMMADVYIIDAIGLLRTFPIIGEEFIDIEFNTPQRKPFKAKFRIFEVVLGSAADNQTQQSYCLKCCNEESFESAVGTIEKGYKNTIDNIVKDIVTKDLKSKKPLFFESTKGIQNITFIRKAPFEAIDMLRKRAASKENTSASYFFFENRYGFNFNTLEGLYDKNKKNIGDKVFTRNVILPENQQPEGFRTILSYNIGRQFNMINSLTLGSLNAYHETFDILRKEFKTKKYSISEFPEFKSPETSGTSVSPFGPDTIQKYGTTPATRYYNISNSDLPDTYLNDFLVKKIAYTGIQLNGSIDIYCYGDSEISAGDVVTIKLPKTDGTTKKQPQEEPLQNGNYVVARTHHSIQFSTGEPKHTITCTLMKGSYKQ